MAAVSLCKKVLRTPLRIHKPETGRQKRCRAVCQALVGDCLSAGRPGEETSNAMRIAGEAQEMDLPATMEVQAPEVAAHSHAGTGGIDDPRTIGRGHSIDQESRGHMNIYIGNYPGPCVDHPEAWIPDPTVQGCARSAREHWTKEKGLA